MLSIQCNSWAKSGGNKVNPFIDKCNWEGINYTSEKDDWKI